MASNDLYVLFLHTMTDDARLCLQVETKHSLFGRSLHVLGDFGQGHALEMRVWDVPRDYRAFRPASHLEPRFDVRQYPITLHRVCHTQSLVKRIRVRKKFRRIQIQSI